MEMKKFMTRDEKINPDLLLRYPRIGETSINKRGSTLEIVDYRKWDQVDVMVITRLESGEFKYYRSNNCEYSCFIKGSIGSPFDKSTCGVGYMGIGSYSSITHPKLHMFWSGMLFRGYNDKYYGNNTYMDVTVDFRFHNFQYFAEWAEQNYYEINGERMTLDKDVLFKGNKIYSPETCCFLPNNLNVMFTKRQIDRGELPIGVTRKDDCTQNPYRVSMSMDGKGAVHIGCFPTPEKAFVAYKEAKEKEIEKQANIYLNEKGGINIPQFRDIVYPALLRYKVEITD